MPVLTRSAASRRWWRSPYSHEGDVPFSYRWRAPEGINLLTGEGDVFLAFPLPAKGFFTGGAAGLIMTNGPGDVGLGATMLVSLGVFNRSGALIKTLASNLDIFQDPLDLNEVIVTILTPNNTFFWDTLDFSLSDPPLFFGFIVTAAPTNPNEKLTGLSFGGRLIAGRLPIEGDFSCRSYPL